MRYLFLLLGIFIFQGCVQQPPQPTSCISKQELMAKSYNELTITAKAIKEQEKAISDFNLLVSLMKGYVNNYSTTIETSARLSSALRVLPIPYAGEVSSATKLISTTLVSLNNSATALHKYKESSTTFLKKYNQLGTNPTPKGLAELSSFADNVLIIDALNVQRNMEQISKTTEGLLTLAEMISSTSSTALNYLGKTKSLLNETLEISNDEKDAIAKFIPTSKSTLAQLNTHIQTLKNSALHNRQGIAKAKVISDLAIEIENKEK